MVIKLHNKNLIISVSLFEKFLAELNFFFLIDFDIK